jgi:hypothetical protein
MGVIDSHRDFTMGSVVEPRRGNNQPDFTTNSVIDSRPAFTMGSVVGPHRGNNQLAFTMGSVIDDRLQMVYEFLLLFGDIIVVGWA